MAVTLNRTTTVPSVLRYEVVRIAPPEWKKAFEEKHAPGTVVVNTGIYRCTGCGLEVAVNVGQAFPPSGHHQHPPLVGAKAAPIEWQLLVYSDGQARKDR